MWWISGEEVEAGEGSGSFQDLEFSEGGLVQGKRQQKVRWCTYFDLRRISLFYKND
jgi:hypothetical protein